MTITAGKPSGLGLNITLRSSKAIICRHLLRSQSSS
jgi:hypothetical protein